VNIIQHDDAGPDETQETIELPPAYTNIRRPLAVGSDNHTDTDTNADTNNHDNDTSTSAADTSLAT